MNPTPVLLLGGCLDYQINPFVKDMGSPHDTGQPEADTGQPKADTGFLEAPIEPVNTHLVEDEIEHPKALDKLDILMVIDNSCSMYANFNTLGNAMSALWTDMETVVNDFQFGVISADSNSPNFQGPFVHDDTNAQIELLMASNQIGNAPGEEGFASSYTFFEYIDGDTVTFTRPEAGLLTFFVSDEDEQSGIPSNVYYDWLVTNNALSKADPQNMIDVISVATLPDSTCESTVGEKYIELSQDYFGKPAVDICESNWDWVSDLSFLTYIPDNVIPLSELPIVSTLEVFYDEDFSDTVPESLTTDWTYNSPDNSIYLGFDPVRGSYLRAEYEAFESSSAGDTADTGN